MFLQCFNPKKNRKGTKLAKVSKERNQSAVEESDAMEVVEYGKEVNIHQLPDEILVLLFLFLEVKDITCVRLVSQKWKQLADSPKIWRELCLSDFNVFSTEPVKYTYETLHRKDWRKTYVDLTDLCGEGLWKGMSKWVEPKGFDHEQETTVTLEFPRKSKKIIGQGSTINYNTPSSFTIEGTFVNATKFSWSKHFATHTSMYEGELDVDSKTLQGKIDYDDGRTKCKGVFLYKRKACCEES